MTETPPFMQLFSMNALGQSGDAGVHPQALPATLHNSSKFLFLT